MIASIALALSLTFSGPAVSTATPASGMASAPADLPLPGTNGVKYREKAGDPVRLASYGLGTKATYLRAAKGDVFSRQKGLSEAVVSPDGRLTAGIPTAYRAGHDSLLITDRATGKTNRIRTVRAPLVAWGIGWSRDSRKVVLTVQRKTGNTWRTAGFTIVDVTAKTARTVPVPGLTRESGFWWSPAGGLVSPYRDGLRLYRPSDGKVAATWAGIGLTAGAEDAFSPSGKRLLSWCPSRFTEGLCLVDPATGRLALRVNVQPEALFGWWDESHVIAVMAHGGAYRLSVVDLAGRTTRVLAELPRATWAAEFWVTFTR
ncbi:hypothetical protein HII36_37945 [Nonomuraea sp. NN258]|uniref:hypothetical protein n=1 Tax=Nonomuraea antri TaxID=2730852 RepID=UPI00156A6A3C|nr:hypothetical protein [Nonomuraea antri]NRQ37573.1 hypothetical protein [Nonomuraea antri]